MTQVITFDQLLEAETLFANVACSDLVVFKGNYITDGYMRDCGTSFFLELI